eukprot:gene25683-24663_t
MKTPTLLFTADDLGITMARSRGILHAIQHGLVNRTSIMANGHAAAEAVELFRAHGQLHTVGLHLNLTEGAPLSPPLTIRSLLQEQNMTMQQPTFKGKGAYHRGCTEGSIVADDIAAEAKAQIAWFVANVVATVLAKVFAEAGVK